MTSQEILAAIAADPALQAFATARNDAAIAEALSVGRTKVSQHFASERGILERFPGGPLAADALLSKLEAFSTAGQAMSSIVHRALKFLAQPEGLDIGAATTQGLIIGLAAGGVITTTERDGLIAMATKPDPITVDQVSKALNGG